MKSTCAKYDYSTLIGLCISSFTLITTALASPTTTPTQTATPTITPTPIKLFSKFEDEENSTIIDASGPACKLSIIGDSSLNTNFTDTFGDDFELTLEVVNDSITESELANTLNLNNDYYASALTVNLGSKDTIFNINGSGEAIFDLTSTGYFRIQNNSTDTFIVDDDGHVGIGISNPTLPLEVEEYFYGAIAEFHQRQANGSGVIIKPGSDVSYYALQITNANENPQHAFFGGGDVYLGIFIT